MFLHQKTISDYIKNGGGNFYEKYVDLLGILLVFFFKRLF
jgi:hypothetical protein